MSEVVVVLPTYNEKENVSVLINQIMLQQTNTRSKLHVLVVDDNSPDGTATAVKHWQKVFPNRVHLLSGPKEGLGVAYRRGFSHALYKLKADAVVQMDADLSHDPEEIPELLDQLDEAEVVIGSRYTKGGRLPQRWPWYRRLNSKVANLVGRHIAGIKGIDDVTGGFRAYRAEALRSINWKNVQTTGYAIQLAVLASLKQLGLRVVETPITFREREKGTSKLRLKDISEFLQEAVWLRINSSGNLEAVIFLLLAAIFVLLVLLWSLLVTATSLISGLMITLSLFLIVQNILNIYSLTYAWSNPEKVKKNASPKVMVSPLFSFTALVPARDEEKVIADTLKAIDDIDYPDELKQTLVVCRSDDLATIEKAEEAIKRWKIPNARVVVFEGWPINKPKGLNEGLLEADGDVVVIFDAEDQPHKQIYNVANTMMSTQDVDVLQSGVQLINYRSRWFSTLNVLEYYFWFKSTLHLYASLGTVTLGGNTVFFKRHWLERVGGWDEGCLTEDADIGLRLSRAGAKFQIVYDATHVTREETPHSVAGFVKQRTRWNQGFLQMLLKGDWLMQPSIRQKLIALYILTLPHFLAIQIVIIPVSVIASLWLKLPLLVALLSIVPLLLLGMQLVIYNLGLYLFTREFKLAYSLKDPFLTLIRFFPYFLLLAASSYRSMVRIFRKNQTWEKTVHLNEHRLSKEGGFLHKAFVKS